MFVPVDATEMPGMPSYVAATPDEERRRQMEAFQATLAKKRAVPQTFGGSAIDRGDAAPGSYIQLGGGQGDYANAKDLGSLAQSGNVDAMLALRRRMQEDERPMRMNETMGDRMGRADQAFAQMMGIGANAFDADTKRSEAGIRELGVKVGGPQQLASEEAREKMRGENQLKIADKSVRAAEKAEHIRANEALRTAGKSEEYVTAAAKKRGQDSADYENSRREDLAPKDGKIKITAGGDVKVGGDDGKGKDLRAIGERDASLGRLGYSVTPDGKPTGEFSAETLVQELVRNPALAKDPEFLAAFKRGTGAKSAKQIKEDIALALSKRATSIQGRNANETYGGVQFHTRPGMVAMTMPGKEGEVAPLIYQRNYTPFPGAGALAGAEFATPTFRGDTINRYRAEASALGDILAALGAN